MSFALRVLIVAIVAASTTASAGLDLFQSPASGNNLIQHGRAVSDAGDVNGDGYPDFIAGAPFDNALGSAAGRAFLWFGGPDMTDTPNVVFDEGSSSDWFGFSVAGIGDVDDDGYDDVAVGAPGDDPNGEKSGAVYVYLGRSVNRRTTGLSWAADTVVAGPVGGDRFGWSVSAAGDMNKDGLVDYVVGAPYSDATGTDRGQAHLFLGSRATSLPTTPAVSWSGPALGGPQSSTDFAAFAPDGQAIQGPGFGWAVTDVADYKGSSTGAVVAVGAPGAAGSIGEVHLFFAPVLTNTLPSTTPGSVLKNGTAAQQFGWSVSRGGLIDGDTRVDIVVGAPGADGGRGLVKVFYGASSPAAEDAIADFVRMGQTAGDRFGFAVADAGNHLGTPGTWVVGAPSRDDAALNAGWVYVFDRTQQIPLDVLPANRTGSGVADDRWGFALSAVGDLDADGATDILIGAPGANVENGSVRGLVGLLSSDMGVVAAEVPRWDVRRADAGRVVLDVFGASLRRAERVDVLVDGSRLASLGDGIDVTFDGVRATFAPEPATASVLLRWTTDAVTRDVTIDLPAFGSVLELTARGVDGGVDLRFTAAGGAAWDLRIVDVRGRVVARPATGAGYTVDRTLRFDGSDTSGARLARGTYFAVLRQGDRVRSARWVLVR